jgi:transcriptional repressor NrdR
MYCPVCRSKETKVVDSRVPEDGLSVRRRRECVKCKYRFSTIEETELLGIVIVKTDARRESYSREKLRHGILRSLAKRPYTQEKFNRLIHTIERDIQKKRKREITSESLGEIVMKRLKTFDKIAYVRFASIYRSFEDVQKFESTIQSLSRKKK